MQPREILNRLTGFSTPLGGVQWTPAKLDIDVARAAIAFLEDRRVLYQEFAGEVPEHCVESAIEIRRFLTQQLGQGGIARELGDSLRAMRASCRQFIDIMQRLERHRGRGTTPYDWAFNQALGELRAAIGFHVAVIAVNFDLPVEEPLASALPPAPEPRDDDPEDDSRREREPRDPVGW
jgi:hypothetical protein